jgi:hypothetical protein
VIDLINVWCKLACGIVIALSVSLANASSSLASVFEVDNVDDDARDADPGDGNCRVSLTVAVLHRCTLRAAIMEANAHAGIDSITLPAGTIRVNSTYPEITESLTITGRGAGSTTILAIPSLEFFATTLHTARNSGLTLRVTGVTLDGADFAASSVQCLLGTSCFITSSVIRGHKFEAIQNANTTVNISKSTLTANGTGVVNKFGGNLTIDSSSISGNTNGVNGPAFSGAGGIFNEASANVTITNSTIAGNSVGFPGNVGSGGIANNGNMTIINSTISGNTGDNGAGAGGIFSRQAGLTLRHVTIANNSGRFGLVIPDAQGEPVMENSILVGNSPANCSRSMPPSFGALNIDSNSSCGFNAQSLSNADPLIGPLAGNGGPTATHALLTGSPAIDRILPCIVLTDQRGISRPLDGDSNGQAACDIGAFERTPPIQFQLPQLGIPGLDPASGTTAPNQTFPLTFSWDVPSPQNWGALQSLDLRIRSDGQIIFGLRWEQVADLFQLLDANGNPVEPQFLGGTPIIVGTDQVKLDLTGARSQGSGITGQNVALTLPLILSDSLAGKDLQIEVTASGDADNTDPFKVVGKITVLGGNVSVSDNDKREREKEKPLTELGRLKKARSNQGGFDDEQTEGNVLAGRCDSSEIDIGSKDGVVTLKLRKDARGLCQYVQVGNYVQVDGQKETEQLYWVDDLDISR